MVRGSNDNMLMMIQMRMAYGRMGPSAETASSNLPGPRVMMFLSLEVSRDNTALFKSQSLTLSRRPILCQDSQQNHFLHSFCVPVTMFPSAPLTPAFSQKSSPIKGRTGTKGVQQAIASKTVFQFGFIVHTRRYVLEGEDDEL